MIAKATVTRTDDGKGFTFKVLAQAYDNQQHTLMERMCHFPENFEVEFDEPRMEEGYMSFSFKLVEYRPLIPIPQIEPDAEVSS